MTGALVALRRLRTPRRDRERPLLVVGGLARRNGAALALLAAWAVPDLRAARSGSYYEGDLLGADALGALLLVLPFAYSTPK